MAKTLSDRNIACTNLSFYLLQALYCGLKFSSLALATSEQSLVVPSTCP